MRYDYNFKINIVNNFEKGDLSISKTAEKASIPKQTLARWIRLYNEYGESGLEKKKLGAKNIPINEESEILILKIWEECNRSKYMMRKDLKKKGVNISEWQIEKVYKKHKL